MIVDVFACKECGKLYLREEAANNCCKTYHCEVCGAEIPKYHLKCAACSEKARYDKARKMTVQEYESEFPGCMVFYDGDYYSCVEELLEQYTSEDSGEMPDYCYGTSQIYMRLRPDNILAEIEEEFDCEGVGFPKEAYQEFDKFAEQFNDKYEQYGFFVEDSIVILIPPELKKEYKND